MAVTPKMLSKIMAMPDAAIREILVEAIKTQPDVVRRWIEYHPANFMFLVGVFNGWKVKPFHHKALEDALRNRETMWLAPRGSGKSLALAVILPAWFSIAHPENMDPRFRDKLFTGAPNPIGPHNIRMALTSNSVEKAVALLFQVKSLLCSTAIRDLYGPMEGERWQEIKADTALRTDKLREATFTALGIGSKIAGGHYDIVFADDWVTEDNARTQLQRERMSDFWKFTIKGTCEPWCRIVVTGTRYHPADWYREIAIWHEKGLWAHIHRTPAINDITGESYWPELYSLEELQRRREQMGAIAFMSQYQNIIELMLGSFFKRPWVEQFVKWNDLPAEDRRKARTVIALDPAVAAGPKADWSVFVVVSYIAPFFYVRKVVRGQWTQFEILALARALYEEYRPEVVGIETVAAFKWLIQELQRTSRIPLRPCHPRGTDKIARADKARTYFEQMRVFLEEPTLDNGIGRLIEEMLAFPNVSDPGWDDTVDAVVWAILIMTIGRTRLHKMSRGQF